MNSDCSAAIAPIVYCSGRVFSSFGIGLLRRPTPVEPGLESLEDHMSHQGQSVIVGAGPVGLGAALFLARQGQVARVVEMRDEPSQHSRALPSTRAGSTSWRGHALRVACWHGVCE